VIKYSPINIVKKEIFPNLTNTIINNNRYLYPMLIINLSNILINCENNEILINYFIDNFNNFTNLFTNLKQKIY